MTRKMNYRIIIGLASILLILLFLWVLGVFDQTNPLDSSPEKVDLDIEFIEINELAIVNSNNNQLASLKQKLPETLPYIFEYCYGVNMQSDSSVLRGLQDFYSKPYVGEAEKYVKSELGNLEKEKENISTCFKRLKFHFPNKPYPKKIVLANSNFVTNASCYNSIILVGLERYLGEKNALIQSLNPDEFPRWIKKGMNKKFLIRDVLSAWISTKMVATDTTGYLTAKMVQWGKTHLLTEMALRLNNEDVNPEIILRWNKAEMKWANENEKAFLDYLYKNELLFSQNEETHAFLLQNGPYSSGFSTDSPDRMGQYLGWKMARKYLFDENISLKELMTIDFDKILKNYVK